MTSSQGPHVQGGNFCATPLELALEPQFNHDLLLHESDRQTAQKLYPELIHVLDHLELRVEFERYDQEANAAQQKVHRAGLWSVVLATLALFSTVVASLPALWDYPEWVYSLPLVFELGGLVGSLIAMGGVRMAGSKKTWLKARLMTERLRQWHFQLLVCRGKEIAASCDPKNPQAKQEFTEARARWFLTLKQELDGNLDATLEDLLGNPAAGYNWLHDAPSKYPAQCPVLEKVFVAYRQLRFKNQVSYAAYKLQRETDKPLWSPSQWPAVVLERRAEALASFCLVTALLLSVFTVICNFAMPQLLQSAMLPGAVMALLVLNVAVRAAQDGLAAAAESHRYHEYSGKIQYLLMRFEAERDPEEKRELMEELEREAVEELRGFLRVHSDARFII